MNIAWIGTGAMGVHMAQHLLKAGHRLKIYNRTPNNAKALLDAGAELAATPKKAAENADIVFSIVTDNKASAAVWEGKDGIVMGLKDQAIAIECSTITPARGEYLANYVRNHSKASFLVAPVIGTYKDAEAKELIFLIGGEGKTLESAKNILELMSKMILPIGNEQQALALKLAITASVSTQLILQTELLNFLKSYDLKPEMTNLFENLPFTSATTELHKKLISGSDNQKLSLFPVSLVEKDLNYLVESQTEKKQKIALSSAARDAYRNVKIKAEGIILEQ